MVTWTTIPDFPDYEASDAGDIGSWRARGGGSRRKSRKVLKPRIRHGRKHVILRKEGLSYTRSVHRLVLEAFVGHAPVGMICCHNDGDPTNNRLENLRWDTHRANHADSLKHGTRQLGSARAHSKLREDDIPSIRDRIHTGESYNSIGRSFGVTGKVIGRIAKGTSWNHV